MKPKRLVILLLIGLICALIWAYNTHTKHYPLSNHYNGSYFTNLNPKETHINPWNILLWKITANPTPWPKYISNNHTTPDLSPITNRQTMRVIFLNHSTVLLQWYNVNIITDPALLPEIGPQYLAWVKRHRPPGLSLEELPAIDYIVISHNHYDHLDRPTLKKIIARDKSQIVVPLGVSQYLPTMDEKYQHELDWWQSYTNPQKNLSVTLVPAFHWSKRNLLISNESLWGGFVIQKDGFTVYFAGDTGYSDHFKQIKQKFPAIDVALLPIGSYEPPEIMKLVHLNPEEAVLAAQDLDSKQNIGIHFGTFRLTDEGIDDPIFELERAVYEQELEAPFVAPKNGETFVIRKR